MLVNSEIRVSDWSIFTLYYSQFNYVFIQPSPVYIAHSCMETRVLGAVYMEKLQPAAKTQKLKCVLKYALLLVKLYIYILLLILPTARLKIHNVISPLRPFSTIGECVRANKEEAT